VKLRLVIAKREPQSFNARQSYPLKTRISAPFCRASLRREFVVYDYKLRLSFCWYLHQKIFNAALVRLIVEHHFGPQALCD
jgi:hypothetical protein